MSGPSGVDDGEAEGAAAGSPWDFADLSGQVIREVDLSGADLRGAFLADTSIDGYVVGMTINGVDITPLIEAELDRLHPERVALRPETADQARHAVDVLVELWAPTLDLAKAVDEEMLHTRVDGEWSFVETLRHLIFVHDAWLGHAALGEDAPFHPAGLPASFIEHAAAYGIDQRATPSYAEVLEVRKDRLARLAETLRPLPDADLARLVGPNAAPGYPPPEQRTLRSCLLVLFNEEWAHHQFAVRDLERLTTGAER